ncbi:PAS domain S-box protein [Phenylobacterium sp. J426]|uniref:PAS domain S-box protein n=1 Tax=Phenylobacterium sp. J426 TaxID=2898439 RepID=UPI002151D509|nr:PAS domain S-box protein [Phenylobacterium sp. J426]MCR5875526.1 PAS domain S-box protein [Phenylobacterium sp. J426]
MSGAKVQSVAEIMASLDQTVSPLGGKADWPAELCAVVDLILPAKAEIVLFWGPDYVALYNDAYAPTIGDKHPRAFGRPAIEHWRELWDDLEPLLAGVRASGKTFHAKDRPFYIERRGGEGETVYFDVSYSPVRRADGGVGGVLCIVSETTSRVRALERVANSEARFQAIADSIDQMIWATRADGFHDYYNRRWYEYTGTPYGSTDGEAWNGMFHPDDQTRAWEVWRRCLETGEPYHIEYRLRHRSGQYRWVLGRAQPVRDEAGRIARWYGTCTDIHDLKVARDALQEEREALQILNAVAARVAAEYDLEKLVQTVVDAGVELSGAEFGAFFYNLLNADGESYMLYALSGAERSAFEKFPMPRNTAVFAPTFEGEGMVRSADITQDARYGKNAPRKGMPEGHLPVRSYLAAPVTLRSGEVVGGLFFGHAAAGVFDERAERLVEGLAAQAAVGIETSRLVQRLQRLNEGLEGEVAARTAERDQIWRTSQDLLLVAGLDGAFRSVSPAWERTLGWRADELVGRSSDWLTHPEDLEHTHGEIARLVGGEVTEAFENRFRHRDGSYRVLAWTATREGELIYAAGRDVTAERRRQQELSDTQERLRQAQKMETVGQLTGGVAHDFNNLLQVVTGNLETLQRHLGPDQPRLRRAADSAMTGARRAATLTQRLLAFARRQPLNPRPLDPNKLIQGMAELLHRTLGEAVAVETVLSPGAWRVEADANGLENAILNLAINARDAMPAGGKLTIETANAHIDADYARRNLEVMPGQYVMFSVSDTGHGMTADVVEKAFEPFYTTKEVGRGTGLGLSMVYGFVKQSGGHVKIYSEVGQGTTVRLYFPRLAKAADLDEDEPPAYAPEGDNYETILVCEDDDDVRAYSVEALRELGYRVLEAHDGPSALRLLERQEGRVDLLFTDVILPSGMTGAEVAKAAREIQPGLPVLFTTGYARSAIVHHGRLDPGVELITKPFTFADLAARIRDSLDAARR